MGKGDSISSDDKEEFDENLAESDLVQALGQLTLSQYINSESLLSWTFCSSVFAQPSRAISIDKTKIELKLDGHRLKLIIYLSTTTAQRKTSDTSGLMLVQEARTILEEKSSPFITSVDELTFIPSSNPALRPPAFPFISSSTSIDNRSSISRNSRPLNVAEIMLKLPTKEAAQKNIGHYWRSIDWYIHPIPTNILNQHLDHVFSSQDQGLEADPFSLANVYVCAGVGLAQLALKPGREADAILAKSWLDLAGDCLVLGGFLECPSLEGRKFSSSSNSIYLTKASLYFISHSSFINYRNSLCCFKSRR